MSQTRTSRGTSTNTTGGHNVGSSTQSRSVPRRMTLQPTSLLPHSPNNRGLTVDTVRQTRGARRSMPASRSLHQQEPSTPDDNASMLRTAGGDIKINDGQFNAVAGSHISVTINTGSGTDMSESRTDMREVDYRLEFSGASTERPGDILQESSILPPQSSWDIYCRHIGAKGRGSPLWVPQPSKGLHIEYQRNGIAIGDVGIITFDGGFDFLFNICLPKDHPINPPDLPEIFTTVNILPRDVQQYTMFREESYLSSESVKRSQQESGVPGLIFESSASEGAILAMPAGSSSSQLLKIGLFRKWVTAHAEDLYIYANDTCGREAKNGDIRLVTGFDKTTKWGMATFSNSSSSTATSSLLLKFRPMDSEGNPSSGRTYGWEYSGMAEVRAGPDKREIEELWAGEPSQEQREYENQCLFLRTLNVTLQEKIWQKLAFGIGEILIDDGLNDTSFQASLPPNFAPSGRSSNNVSQQVYSSTFPTAMSWHPSNDINELLLKVNPDARMAIMDDSDWISILKESDRVVPSTEQILTRLLTNFFPRTEEGAIFLEQNPDPEQELQREQEDNKKTKTTETEALQRGPQRIWERLLPFLGNNPTVVDASLPLMPPERDALPQQLPLATQTPPSSISSLQIPTMNVPFSPSSTQPKPLKPVVVNSTPGAMQYHVLQAAQKQLHQRLPPVATSGLPTAAAAGAPETGMVISAFDGSRSVTMPTTAELELLNSEPRLSLLEVHQHGHAAEELGADVIPDPRNELLSAYTVPNRETHAEEVNVERRVGEIRKGKGKEREIVDLSPKPNKSTSMVNVALNDVLATEVKQFLAAPSLFQNKSMIVLATSEPGSGTDSEDDASGSSEQMTDDETAEQRAREEQLRQQKFQQQLLLQRQRQQQRPQSQQKPVHPPAVKRTQSSNYPALNTRGGGLQHRQPQVRTQALMEKAALEVRRQREMFVKLPKATTHSVNLLTQLMNPNPEVFSADASIPLSHPYNLPIPVPPSTPRTTRRLMISSELSESLRQSLVWERQASKANLTGLNGIAQRGGSSRSTALEIIQPPTVAPNMLQLHAKRAGSSGDPDDPIIELRLAAGAPHEQERAEAERGDQLE